jgi:hypothetical protein
MADPEDGIEMAENEEPMDVKVLYGALEKCTDAMAPGRAEAEAMLKQAEASARPGFLSGLLQIVREPSVKEVGMLPTLGLLYELCSRYGSRVVTEERESAN